MGKTLSFNHIGAGLGIYPGSALASTLFTLFLISSLVGCFSSRTESYRDLPSQAALPQATLPSLSVTKEIKGMVWIPPGPFLMGTDEVDLNNEAQQLGFPQPWFEDEHPLRKVHLPGFYIDRHEVSQGAYLAFVRKVGHRPPAHWQNGEYKVGTEKQPVSFVDWYDANDYCRWQEKRLPTEAEWEKAARGPGGRRYPWGEQFQIDRAHLSPASDVSMQLAPVGRYPEGASVYGVFDMVGNVWEWTESWYLPYPESNLRKSEFGMKYRAVRGLSFHSLGHYPDGAYPRVLEVYARAATRSYDPPSERLGDLGFRCVKRERHH